MQNSEELSAAFSSVLAAVREKQGLTQMSLAAKAGLHLNTVSKFERGMQLPNLETLFALAGALNVSPSELIAGVERRVPRPKRG